VKGSLKLRPPRVLSRKEAWACFTANLALPGSGSLAAGRSVGYWQLVLAFLADAICVITAIPLFEWVYAGGLTQSPLSDPFQNMSELWVHARGPMAGVGVLLVAIFWATMTSQSILAEAPKDDVPPRIQ
jgi:hypothetical protein